MKNNIFEWYQLTPRYLTITKLAAENKLPAQFLTHNSCALVTSKQLQISEGMGFKKVHYMVGKSPGTRWSCLTRENY
jgi:hypothetical protein